MEIDNEILGAINNVSILHKDQIRKGSGDEIATPYISHPFSVAMMLLGHTNDKNVIIAALYHDTLEDISGYSLETLTRDTNKEVADIVLGVTEPKEPMTREEKIATWEERKVKYIENLKSAGIKSLLVAMADKISNLHSMKDKYRKIGENLWEEFSSPPHKRLWVAQMVLALAEEQKKSIPQGVENFDQLVARLKTELEDCQNIISKK
jgi:(p)ppGpp synthase/HD superfamily hydrolase